ncbi:MAG: histidine--tRNA ligase [Candidatus Pacebacteria bacterium]|nr:histidine--tRNA ligase [Candidatus Paceibacterota bacterium]
MSEREPLSTEPYKGVRDFYPAYWSSLTQVFDTLRATLRSYGYEEYNASPLERAELYEQKTSEEIVNEQTYTFEDRGERKVTLRPEMTPTFARMLAAKRRAVPFPVRWFSIPNVFRYERPQRGRLREHYQLNVDLAGISDQKADGEIITIAHAIMKSLGAKDSDFVIRISSRALLSAACAATGFDNEEAIRLYSRLLDKKSKMPLHEFEAALGPGRSDPLKAIEAGTDAAVAEERARMEGFIAALKERGVTNVVFDPEIVRGFDYYTGVVFEIYDTDPANARSIFGGGRYDGLITLFGGDPIPCVGFGMGDVTLMDFLETHGLKPAPAAPADVFIGTPTESDIPAAQLFADELRANGTRVLVNVSDKGLGDQIRDATRRGIPYFIAFGDQEASSGIVRVKTLESGEEIELSRADVTGHVK